MTREREAYLGDGLYASYDSNVEYIYLRAPRLSGDHIVALEPPVLARFVEYACQQGYRQTIEEALKEAK